MRRSVLALLPLFVASCGSAPEPSAAVQIQGPAARQTRGLDDATMARTIEAASRLPRLRSLVVLRHGKTLVEHRFNNGPPLDRPVNIKSASKSVISALVGIAIERGVLKGVDQPVLSMLRNDAPANPNPRLDRLTVGNLLSMQAGLERTSGPNYGRWVSSPNWVRYALARPFVDEPGGAMLYSTGNTHLLSAMLTRASGQSTYTLAQDWLARPLAIAIPSWPRRAGHLFRRQRHANEPARSGPVRRTLPERRHSERPTNPATLLDRAELDASHRVTLERRSLWLWMVHRGCGRPSGALRLGLWRTDGLRRARPCVDCCDDVGFGRSKRQRAHRGVAHASRRWSCPGCSDRRVRAAAELCLKPLASAPDRRVPMVQQHSLRYDANSIAWQSLSGSYLRRRSAPQRMAGCGPIRISVV